MQHYRLYQGKLRPHDEGKWVRAEDVEQLQAIVEAAWKVRTEAVDYTSSPDLGLRATFREDLHRLLDQWKADAAKVLNQKAR